LEMIVRVWRDIAPERSVHVGRVGWIMGVRRGALSRMRRHVRGGSMTWDMSRWKVWRERVLGGKVVCIARGHVLQWRYRWETVVGWICRGTGEVDLERA